MILSKTFKYAGIVALSFALCFGLFIGLNQVSASSRTKIGASRIYIKRINVYAKLVPVSYTASGEMASPSNGKDVVIYSQGATVGSGGNIVVSGHRDTRFGRAVFYNLKKLRVNDRVILTDKNGQQFSYYVTGSKTYNVNEFPTDKIFANNGSALQMITCTGKYDRKTKQYSQRLVVTAKPRN